MSDANNLDWKTYESITKYIYETLGEKSGVKIKGYGNRCKVPGKSGVIHQIDVLHHIQMEFTLMKLLLSVNIGRTK